MQFPLADIVSAYAANTPFKRSETALLMSIGLALLLVTYFVMAVGVAALLLLPAARDVLRRSLVWVKAAARNPLQWLHAQVLLAAARETSRRACNALHWLPHQRHRRRGLMTLAVMLLIALPVTAALLLRRHQALPGFGVRYFESDPVVSSLLLGEALVPPPPLPPQIFVTREVAVVRADLATASREWALLDEDFRHRLLTVYRSLAQQGYTLALLEGYRSPERQAQLRARGSSVTNAGAYQSYHQFGLAADSAFYRDGRLVISERDPWAMRGYQLLGEAAEAQGLRWGGRWQLQDYGHVELRRPGVLGPQ